LIQYDYGTLKNKEMLQFRPGSIPIGNSKNEIELTNARETWKSLLDAGLKTSYWAEDNGKWTKKD